MPNNQQVNSFVCSVRDGGLFDYSGNQVGVTMDKYNAAINERNSAMEAAHAFEEKLYEAGILQRPKTPEQITAELQATVQGLANVVSKLSERLEILSTGAQNVNTRPDSTVVAEPSGVKFI